MKGILKRWIPFLAIGLFQVIQTRTQQPNSQSGLVKYPISGELVQYQPHFESSSLPRRYHLHEDHPPCNFNTQCICSNTGPDLGLVFCDDVELGRIPADLNNTKIHTLTLRNNRLRHLDEYSVHGTGMYRLEIRQNLLFSLPERALWGIERSMWQLDLSYNRFSSVPSEALHLLRKLSHLDLTGNQISDIRPQDFSGLENSLKTLILAENSIVKVPNGVFQRLRTVRTIDLRGNNIHQINSGAFKDSSIHLTNLNFANNLLTTIPFEAISEVRNLQTLNLARNKISKTYEVTFNGILSLDSLILDMNEIEALAPYSFQNFGSINRTSLRSNPLTEISNDAFKDAKLKELYLHDCRLDFISETAFRGLEMHLKVLDLSYNNISTLPEKVFENLDLVNSLSISNNKLSMDPKTSFNGFKDTLQYLNLLGRKMGRFPVESLKEMRNVRTLGLSSLPDSTLSKNDFKGFGPAVEKLYLLDNDISSIGPKSFEHVPGVKILDLSFNNIGTLDNEAFTNIGGGLEMLKISSGLAMSRLPPQPMIYLTNLRTLDFSNNDLNRVDGECFRYMRSIREINLQDNKIKRLDKDHFQGQFHQFLETIKLSYNSITDIETQTFHDYKTLKTIYLNDNMIRRVERFAFLNLENLKYLHLQGNNIRELSFEAFQNLPKLRLLDVSFNEMDNLNLDAFEQVGTLSTLTIDASYNRISNLKLNGTMWNSYSGIKMLIFSNNNISSISPNYFESVRSSIVHMWFDYNNMKNISREIFESMPHLRLLNFAHNKIEIVDPRAFRGTLLLEYLNLAHNHIADLAMNMFEGQRKLRHFDISYNDFKKIPGELFSESPLEILQASHNAIISFPDFGMQKVTYENIRVIDLSYNEIADLKYSVMSRLDNLVFLDISHNNIMTIDSRALINLGRLVSLNLSHNNLKRIEGHVFEGLRANLHDLQIANTSTTSVPEMNFDNLMEFNVSHNAISFLPTLTFSNLSTLRVLDVSHNELSTAANSAWPTLPRLRWLILSNNPILSISNDSFIGLQSLERLHVRQLPLHRFENAALSYMENLREFSFTSKPRIQRFSIGQALSWATSIQSLVLELEGELDSQLTGFPLPQKLSNITLTGRGFTKISSNAFQMLTSRELRLTVRDSALKQIPRSFFKNLGQVRFLALQTTNNSLRSLGDPSTTVHPGEPETTFLTDFRMDGDDWGCDCSIGWIESWMKSWRGFSCKRNSGIDCEEALRSIRRARCQGGRGKSLMESLKKDLECGTTSSAGLNRENTSFVVSVLVVVSVWMTCV